MAAPKIYYTDIPDRFISELNNFKKCIISAETGTGKTLMLIDTLAHHIKNGNHKSKAIILIPTRPAVLSIWSYASNLFDHKIGYRMHDDCRSDNTDDVTLIVTGYYFEYILHNKSILTSKRSLYITVDEAHDADWRTDLLIRILLWATRKNPRLKVILSSATLNTNIYKSLMGDFVHLKDERTTRNVEVNFIESYVSPLILISNLLKGKLNNHNTLIVVPGEKDIYKIMNYLGEIPELFNCSVYPLHSTLDISEIKKAISACEEPDVWTIIISTNIVENAITIKGLQAVIDLGRRKVMSMSEESPVANLIEEKATKANIIQSTGRVGRENHRGIAYVAITKRDYENLKDFPEPDIYKNPLYDQIVSLMRGDYPIFDILCDPEVKDKLKSNIEDLVDNGFVEFSTGDESHLPGSIKLTENGMVYSKLNLSLRSSAFLIDVLKSGDTVLSYYAVILAVYIDLKSSIFYKPKRKYKQSQEEYAKILDEIEEKQSKYRSKCYDTIETALSIWAHDPNYDSAGLFGKTMSQWKKTVTRILVSLKNLGFTCEILKKPDIFSINKIRLQLIPFLYDVYKSRVLSDLYVASSVEYDDKEYMTNYSSFKDILLMPLCIGYSKPSYKLVIINDAKPSQINFRWLSENSYISSDVLEVILKKMTVIERLKLILNLR